MQKLNKIKKQTYTFWWYMGTHYKGTDDEILALDAFIKIKRAVASVTQFVQGNIISFGLTECQFGVLEALHHLGRMNQKSLGEKLLTTPGNITMVIDNLEKQGLVKRIKSTYDRRSYIIELTKSGDSLISSIFPVHVQSIKKCMSVLTKEELEVISTLSKKLGVSVLNLEYDTYIK